MGCDIHLFAEVKKRKTFKDKLMFWKPKKWVCVSEFEKNEYYEEYPEEEREFHPVKYYTGGRSYNVFSALAGVRTHSFKEPPEPVSHPKGTPTDVSYEVKQEIDSWTSDAHSNSWNTLEELKNYNWSQWGKTCNQFTNEIIKKLESQNVKDTDVRIVYFFDN